jgi:hypothetical protein
MCLFGSVQKVIDISFRVLWRVWTKLQEIQLTLLAGVVIESRSPNCEIFRICMLKSTVICNVKPYSLIEVLYRFWGSWVTPRYIPEDGIIHSHLCEKLKIHHVFTLTDLINALPGNSSVNTVQHATTEEDVFSVDPPDAPIDWLDSDHVICVYCRFMFVPRLYNESREL